MGFLKLYEKSLRVTESPPHCGAGGYRFNSYQLMDRPLRMLSLILILVASFHSVNLALYAVF